MRERSGDVGRRGEDAAARWLEMQGWTVHARGERIAGVEIDVVATDPSAGALVVVEVKARRVRHGASPASVRPEERVNRAKLARLSRAARCLEAHARRLGLGVRVDVIAVQIGPGGADMARIEHFRDATIETGG